MLPRHIGSLVVSNQCEISLRLKTPSRLYFTEFRLWLQTFQRNHSVDYI